MNVPLVDLAWQHRAIAAELEPLTSDIMECGRFVLGPELGDFESRFAGYCGAAHCVGVANGTDALTLALVALGIGPGDEVIVPTNSFVASAAAVVHAGARPVLVDADVRTLLIDRGAVEAAITGRTRAIMPVHLFGRLVDVAPLRALADAHGLKVVGDAAQAQGARPAGGTLVEGCDIVATSFYPGKNLGAYGDGGAVLTDDPELAEQVRTLRNHGSRSKYLHVRVGWNSRLDNLQAAVLGVKLRHLDDWNDSRRAAARRYDELLAEVEPVRRPDPAFGDDHVWHLYAVRTEWRDAVLASLQRDGIGAGVHYPTPIHLQPAFSAYRRDHPLPVAERAARELLSLPLFPGITDAQQEHVVSAIERALRQAR